MYSAMKHVGRLLATKYITATGGYGGSGMQAAIHGASEAGGDVVGYGMLGLQPNPFFAGQRFEEMSAMNLKYRDDSGSFPLTAEQQFGLRLGSLLEADGFVIGAEGRVGTLTELAAIVNLNLKIWPKRIGHTKPVAILHPNGSQSGWDNYMLYTLAQFGVLPSREEMPFLGVFGSPEEAFNWVDIRIQ